MWPNVCQTKPTMPRPTSSLRPTSGGGYDGRGSVAPGHGDTSCDSDGGTYSSPSQSCFSHGEGTGCGVYTGNGGNDGVT